MRWGWSSELQLLVRGAMAIVPISKVRVAFGRFTPFICVGEIEILNGSYNPR